MEDAIRKGRAGNRPVRVSPKRVRRHSPKMIAAQCTIIFFTVVLLVVQFIPIYITVAKSFKNLEQDFLNPYGLTFPFAWSNYEFAWDMVKSLFLNTFILAFANVFGTLALSSLGAFAFVRFKFPFKETIFTAILAIMMIPGTLTLVAQFMLVDSLSLLHTRWAVILPTIAATRRSTSSCCAPSSAGFRERCWRHPKSTAQANSASSGISCCPFRCPSSSPRG